MFLNLNGVFTHLFEKGKNAPPISKPCLLVISRNRKRPSKVWKTPKEPESTKRIAKSGMVGGCKIGGVRGEVKRFLTKLKINGSSTNRHENILKRAIFNKWVNSPKQFH